MLRGIEMTSLLSLRWYLSANKHGSPDLPALSPQQLYTAWIYQKMKPCCMLHRHSADDVMLLSWLYFICFLNQEWKRAKYTGTYEWHVEVSTVAWHHANRLPALLGQVFCSATLVAAIEVGHIRQLSKYVSCRPRALAYQAHLSIPAISSACASLHSFWL